MALSPEDIAMLKEAGVVDEAAEARYEALVARGSARAARSRKPVQAREARLPEPVEKLVAEVLLRRRIDQAVREALARPEVAESLDQAVGGVSPGKPLHEMTAEEWRAHTRGLWASRLPYAQRPMTIQDWVNGGNAAGGEA